MKMIDQSSDYTESQNTLIKVMDFTVDKLTLMKNSVGVLGEKIEVDGLTVIPVSKISIGFAGGGSDIVDEKQKQRKSQNPAGTGAGISETPMVFLVIKDGDAKLLQISGASKGIFSDIIESVAQEAQKLFEKNKKQ